MLQYVLQEGFYWVTLYGVEGGDPGQGLFPGLQLPHSLLLVVYQERITKGIFSD